MSVQMSEGAWVGALATVLVSAWAVVRDSATDCSMEPVKDEVMGALLGTQSVKMSASKSACTKEQGLGPQMAIHSEVAMEVASEEDLAEAKVY